MGKGPETPSEQQTVAWRDLRLRVQEGFAAFPGPPSAAPLPDLFLLSPAPGVLRTHFGWEEMHHKRTLT